MLQQKRKTQLIVRTIERKTVKKKVEQSIFFVKKILMKSVKKQISRKRFITPIYKCCESNWSIARNGHHMVAAALKRYSSPINKLQNQAQKNCLDLNGPMV